MGWGKDNEALPGKGEEKVSQGTSSWRDGYKDDSFLCQALFAESSAFKSAGF